MSKEKDSRIARGIFDAKNAMNAKARNDLNFLNSHKKHKNTKYFMSLHDGKI